MQTRRLMGLALVGAVAACSGTDVIGSGGGTTGGSGGGAGLAAGGTGVGDGTGGSAPADAASGAGGTGADNGTGGTGVDSGTGGGETSTNGSGGSSPGPCITSLVATNDASYAITVGGNYANFNVKPNSELTLDWSGLAHNLAGDALDPATDVDNVVLALTHVSPFELSSLLVDNDIDSSIIDAMWEFQTGAALTTASTFDFTLTDGMKQPRADFLSYFDAAAYPPASHSYFALISKGTTIGLGVQTLALISLNETSTDTTIALNDDSVRVTARTSHPGTPDPRVPVGFAGLTVDFSRLTQDAIGQMFVWQGITRAEVVMTSGIDATSRDALLALPRDHVWSAATILSSISLATLRDDAGNAFPGVDREHGWLLELYGADLLPIPAYLTVLDPACND